ncbi:unnamed protein product [Caenorhabditis sp. 36 PRJEB53466]|nr:unnamed protein product [Caenorhabditis sp. 36 PRJEB53466]
MLAANLMIKPYELGVRNVEPSGTLLKQWWTGNSSEYIVLGLQDTETCFFILAGFLKWHYTASMVNVLLALSIERLFACYYISDYEKKSRNCILIGIMIGWHVFSLFTAILFLYGRQFNLKLIRSQAMFFTPYALAARFQAQENMKCFRMIQNVLIVAILFVLFDALTNLLILSNAAPFFDTLTNFIIKNTSNTCPALSTSVLVYSVKSWRKHCFVQVLNEKITMIIEKRQRRRRVGNTFDRIHADTDAYFEQLHAAWN